MISYQWLPCSAADGDYNSTSVTLILQAGEQSVHRLCTNITIIDDDVLEDVEIFFVFLESSNPMDVIVNSTREQASVSIVDNDCK